MSPLQADFSAIYSRQQIEWSYLPIWVGPMLAATNKEATSMNKAQRFAYTVFAEGDRGNIHISAVLR